MKFTLALMIAINFWHARGVEVPCQPTAVSGADALLPAYAVMGAQMDTCRILLSSGVAYYRKYVPVWYCAYVAHEVGHFIFGAQHAATGLMAPKLTEENVPYPCQRWKVEARRLANPRYVAP